MEFDIYVTCLDCGGYGIREHQIAVDEFADSDCSQCDGSGYTRVRETHEDFASAQADYPKDLIFHVATGSVHNV
jgi:DnaJ-class molecular chaperone